MNETDGVLADHQNSISVRALLVGERLDTRGLERGQTLAIAPLTIRAGRDGCAVLFRYGVAVLFNLTPMEEDEFCASLARLVFEPLAAPESDEGRILIKPEAEEQVDPSGLIFLKEATPERLQLVAFSLAKSQVLAHYETRVAAVFDHIEPLAGALHRGERSGSRGRELLSRIGEVMLTQHKMVGRVEIEEKPDVLWDHPELERLYARLEDEYELRERTIALDRKLALINNTVSTLLDLDSSHRSHRLELYVVLLIVVEVLLSLFQIVFHR